MVEFNNAGDVVARSEKIGKTKTLKSVRTFIMPDIVVTVLKDWFQYCKDNNIVSEFVFPNTETGTVRSYSGLRSLLERFIKRHKLQD